MRLILALAALPLIGAAPAPVERPARPGWPTPVFDPHPNGMRCPDTPMSLARQRAERPQLRRLDELPDAQAFAAVDRRIDNCPAPMLLSEARR